MMMTKSFKNTLNGIQLKLLKDLGLILFYKQHVILEKESYQSSQGRNVTTKIRSSWVCLGLSTISALNCLKYPHYLPVFLAYLLNQLGINIKSGCTFPVCNKKEKHSILLEDMILSF